MCFPENYQVGDLWKPIVPPNLGGPRNPQSTSESPWRKWKITNFSWAFEATKQKMAGIPSGNTNFSRHSDNNGLDEDCDRDDLPSLTYVGCSERLCSGPMKFWLVHYVRIPCHRATLQSRNQEGCLWFHPLGSIHLHENDQFSSQWIMKWKTTRPFQEGKKTRSRREFEQFSRRIIPITTFLGPSWNITSHTFKQKKRKKQTEKTHENLRRVPFPPAKCHLFQAQKFQDPPGWWFSPSFKSPSPAGGIQDPGRHKPQVFGWDFPKEGGKMQVEKGFS